jgi:hypothetical protein
METKIRIAELANGGDMRGLRVKRNAERNELSVGPQRSDTWSDSSDDNLYDS